jgi:hypothetical protein
MIRAMLRRTIATVAAALGLSAATGSASQTQPADMGRELRRMFMGMTARDLHLAPTPASFPYPSKDAVRFYLLGYDGVRFVEGAIDPIQEGTAPLSPLFGAAQDVVTALRQRP